MFVILHVEECAPDVSVCTPEEAAVMANLNQQELEWAIAEHGRCDTILETGETVTVIAADPTSFLTA